MKQLFRLSCLVLLVSVTVNAGIEDIIKDKISKCLNVFQNLSSCCNIPNILKSPRAEMCLKDMKGLSALNIFSVFECLLKDSMDKNGGFVREKLTNFMSGLSKGNGGPEVTSIIPGVVDSCIKKDSSGGDFIKSIIGKIGAKISLSPLMMTLCLVKESISKCPVMSSDCKDNLKKLSECSLLPSRKQ